MKRSRKTKKQKEDKTRRLNLTYGAKRIITHFAEESASFSEDSGSLFIKSLRMVKSNWKLFFILFLAFSIPLLGLAFANLYYARRNNERTDPLSPRLCASYDFIEGKLSDRNSVGISAYWIGMEHLEFGQPQTVNDCIEILSEQQTAITVSKQKKIAIVVEAAPAGKKIDCSFMRIKGERCFGGDTKEHIEWSEGEARTYVRGQQIKSFLQEYNELARNEARFTNSIKEQMALALSTLSAMEASAAHIDPKAYNESQLLFQVYKDPEREYLMKRSEVQVMTELLAHSKNGSRYIDFFTANKRLITLKHPMFDLMTNITELFNRHDSFYKTALDLSKEYVVFVVLGKNHLRSQRDGLREAAKYLIGKLKSSASEMPFVVLYQFKKNRGCSNGALFNETEFMKSTLFIFTMYTAANLITLKLLFKRENEWNYMWAHESENLNTPVERTTEESSTFAPS